MAKFYDVSKRDFMYTPVTLPKRSESLRCIAKRSGQYLTNSHFDFGSVNRPDLQNAHQSASIHIGFVQSEWGIQVARLQKLQRFFSNIVSAPT